MIELDDWAAHLMRAEVQLKALEKHLLNKNYNDVQAHATAAKHYIDKTMAWPHQEPFNRFHSRDRATEVGAAVLAEVRL
jgi:hypothetical protein